MSKVVPPQFYPFRPLPLNHAPSHSLSVALHIHFGPETTILAFSEAQSSGYVERCDRNIMRALLAASMLGASLRSGRAAVVEAGILTTVTVQAPLYDTTTSPADGGCSPEGCVGDNTRVSPAAITSIGEATFLTADHSSIIRFILSFFLLETAAAAVVYCYILPGCLLVRTIPGRSADAAF